GEGLMLYNIDAQGARLTINAKRFYLGYVKVADMYEAIGLGIQDYDELSLGIAKLPLSDVITLDASAGLFSIPKAGAVVRYPETSPRGELVRAADMLGIGATASARLSQGDAAAVYSQAALRAGRSEHLLSRAAYVVGAEGSFAQSDLSIDYKAEYRFYGGLFNAGLRNSDVYYRDPDGGYYGNTVGPALYPLTHYDRPFSQWAVFTEYQDLKDVQGATVRAVADWQFSTSFAIRGDVDLNYIIAENTDGYLYPFYTFGIGWVPSERFRIDVSATNRTMNLDKTYPTLYMLTAPNAMFTLRWSS
ncbi:MAG: hypothetical protein H7X80_03475, partial [bacterium]|nr:hypothetical protein [Candidatus Kapabacteria bacterium]